MLAVALSAYFYGYSSISYTLYLPAGPHIRYSPCLNPYFPSSTHLACTASSMTIVLGTTQLINPHHPLFFFQLPLRSVKFLLSTLANSSFQLTLLQHYMVLFCFVLCTHELVSPLKGGMLCFLGRCISFTVLSEQQVLSALLSERWTFWSYLLIDKPIENWLILYLD